MNTATILKILEIKKVKKDLILRYDKLYCGICFGCEIQDNRFNDCTTIDDNKKEVIISKYDAYLTKYKADKHKNKLLQDPLARLCPRSRF